MRVTVAETSVSFGPIGWSHVPEDSSFWNRVEPFGMEDRLLASVEVLEFSFSLERSCLIFLETSQLWQCLYLVGAYAQAKNTVSRNAKSKWRTDVGRGLS
jgi:hypothetical protein